MFSLDYDFQVSLCCIYAFISVASIWVSLFSPYIFDWMGVELMHKVEGRNWPKRFLISLVLQPVTFTAAAIALWWYPLVVIFPPVHLFATIFCLIVIDVTRPDEPWEKGYKRLF